MNCPGCGAASVGSNRFCEACGSALPIGCSACGAPLSSGARFCGSCGAAVGSKSGADDAAPSRASEERRLATVLFCDLVGFTSMSESMDHEDVKVLASACTDLMSREVERFGGTVTALMGDSVMAVFGAPVAHEDDPERAVRAATSIRDRIGSIDGAPRELAVHAGINTGEIMAGMFGSGERQDYTAMGDTTNTAARLMSAASTGEILVGELTYAATRHAVSYGDCRMVVAKGKSDAVQAWNVQDAHVPVARPLGTSGFVGRSVELGALTRLWEHVTEASSIEFATLVGMAGIGKTRLAREAISAFGGEAQTFWGRCLAYGEGITYWPLVEIVQAAAGIGHDDAVDVANSKLAALLDSLPAIDDEARSVALAAANLLGLPATSSEGTPEASSIAKGELHWAIGRLLQLLATDRPTVLVFEDLHWAEPTLLEFLSSLAASRAAAPLLVLATARPEVLDASELSIDDDHFLVLRLEGLRDDDCRAMLAELVGSDAQARVKLDALLRNAEGNPLFLEETVRMLATVDALEDGRDLASIPIPTSVQGLIGARLDLIPSEHRRLAQHGSVVGQVFWSGALAHISAASSDLDEGLQGLVTREVLELHRQSTVAGEREFGFRHILIRDVAYGRLPKAERSVLHARCADWFEGLRGGPEELVEFVAFHLEQSCLLGPAFGPESANLPVARAVAALSAAAEKAEHREGLREAHRFYERALALVKDAQSEVAVELRLKRAKMAAALGELFRAAEELRSVEEDAQHLGRFDLRGDALVALANVQLKQGLAGDAKLCLEESRTVAESIGDRMLAVRTSYESSAVKGDFEGDVDGAIEELRGAVAVAIELGSLTLEAEGLLREGNLLVNVGRLAEAQHVLAACVETAERSGSRRDEARATFLLGLVTYYCDGPAPAEELGLRAHEWLERIGDGYMLPQSLRALAKYALSIGRPDLAEERLRAALELSSDGGGWVVVELCRYLSESLVDQGRLEEARKVAARARAAVPEEDGYARSAALLADALPVAAGAEPQAAWDAFTEAIALMKEQQLWMDAAEAELLHAAALARHGRRAEAIELLVRARGVFESSGSHWFVTSIDQRLADLRDERAGAAASAH